MEQIVAMVAKDFFDAVFVITTCIRAGLKSHALSIKINEISVVIVV
jgi:hypothetical protein